MRHGMLTSALLAGLTLGPAVQASALFDGSNANLWLVDDQARQLTGYTAGGWLSQFAPGGEAVYSLDPGQQALVNEVPGSSLPLSAGLPWLSLAGLGAAEYNVDTPEGQPMLRLEPADGDYTSTIAVEIFVATDEIEQGPIDLTWQIDSAPEQTRTLTEDDLKSAEAEIQNGYWRHRFHLVRDGTYSINARLNASDGTLLTSQSRSLTLATDHADGFRRDTDGDGLPDLVEAAIGLDPLSGDDWQHDSDGDGWSDFDIWLRDGGTYSLTVDGKPLDSDNDGWSDFDEDLRGTNPNDPELKALLAGNETLDSESFQQRRLRFMDFPAATRLYEVEHELDGTLAPQPLADPVDWAAVRATRLHGAALYDRDDLITGDDLDDAELQPDDLAERRLASLATDRLNSDAMPLMRLPAGDHAVLAAAQRFAGDEDRDAYTQVYKGWLPRVADVSPATFLEDKGVGTWTTVAEWRSAFIDYLKQQLVRPLTPELNTQSTVNLAILEAALSQEARLREQATPQLFANSAYPVSRAVLDAVGRYWRQQAQGEYQWQALHDRIAGNQADGELLQALAEDMTTRLATPQPGQRSDRALVEPYLAADAGDALYRARLLLLPEAHNQLGDATLHQPGEDSDGDSLTNLSELDAPLHDVSLPWADDTDGDSLADATDPCPVDPLNGCDGDADLPELSVAASISVDEPGVGAGMALLTLTLNRPVDRPVRIFYQTLEGDGSALAGVDFEAVENSVVIPAGSRTVTIPLPLLPDAENEGDEQFQLVVTQVENASLVGDGEVAVTVRNTQAQPPQARVANAVLNVPERNPVWLDASPSTDPAGFALAFLWSQTGGSTDGIAVTDTDRALASFDAPEVTAERTLSFQVEVANEVDLTATETVTVNIQPVEDPPEITGTPQFNAVQGQPLDIAHATLLEKVREPDGQDLSVDGIASHPLGRLIPVDAGFEYYAPLGERSLTAPGAQFLARVDDDRALYLDTATSGSPVVAYDARSRGTEVLTDTGSITGILSAPGQSLAYFHDESDSQLYQWHPENGLQQAAYKLPFPRSVVDALSGDLYTCDATDSGNWVRTDRNSLAASSTTVACADTDAVQGVALDDRFCIAQTHQLYCTDGAGNLNATATFDASARIRGLEAVGDQLLVSLAGMPGISGGNEYQVQLLQPDDSRKTLISLATSADFEPAVLALEDGSRLLMLSDGTDARLWRWSGKASDDAETVALPTVQVGPDQVGDLVRFENRVYWLHPEPKDLQVLDILDPASGNLTFVESVTGRGDIPLELLATHQRLHWLSAPVSGGTDVCDLTRLEPEGTTASVLEDIACAMPFALGLDVLGNRDNGTGPEVWVYDGLAVGAGKTGFDLDVSDTQGNSVELPGVIEIAAP